MSLVGHWPLHEWNGDAADLSENGNDGTVSGATQGVAGVGGLTAYKFDGSSDYVDTGYSPTLSDTLTLSVWVKWHDLTDGDGHYYFSCDDGGYDWGLSKADDTNEFEVFTGSNSLSVGVKPETDIWYHTVAVFDVESSQVKYYLNGELELQSSDFSTGSTANNYWLGASPNSGGGSYSPAILSDARIYDRVLSPQEIQELYEWGSGDYTRQSLHDGSDSGAVSRWFQGTNVTADSWGSNDLTDNTSAGTTSNAVDGQAKGFDGSDDIMPTGYNPNISDITISAWVRIGDGDWSSATDWRDIVDCYEGSSNNWCRLAKDTSGGLSFMTDVSGTFIEATDADFDPGDNWIHACGVRDTQKSEIVIYGNGVPLDSANITDTSSFQSANDFAIGARTDGDEYFLGDIDDVRIYDRALSAAEVAQLYRWGTGGLDMRQRLVIQ